MKVMSSKYINQNNTKFTKKSCGIACLRTNSKKQLEILLVKKRYTYEFCDFVLGNYDSSSKENINNSVKALINNMTIHEKIDILSLNFDTMWFKIWLESPVLKSYKPIINTDNAYETIKKIKSYEKKKKKFSNVFLRDNGERLKNIILNSKNNTSIELMWEIPKGRKRKIETNLDCAMREFKEETNIEQTDYNILFDIKPITETLNSSSTTYIHKYYVAYSTYKAKPELRIIKNLSQVTEISSIKWLKLNEIKFLDNKNKLYYLVSKVFSVFRSKYSTT